MQQNSFKKLYDKLHLPVVVCNDDGRFVISYMNPAAKLVFAPSLAVEQMARNKTFTRLRAEFLRVVRFQNPAEGAAFTDVCRSTGETDNFKTTLLSFQGNSLPVTLYANAGELDGESYYLIYVHGTAEPPWSEETRGDDFLTRLLEITCHTTDVDAAIQAVIDLVGKRVKASRAYIFEDISPEMTRNTYEWCEKGVEPAIQDLQNLRKNEYNYDVIMSSSGIITDDTGALPEIDREILQRQGIKALAVIPLHHLDQPLGYIGFDDCVSNRQWSLEEIRLLKNTASIVASLITRRNAERNVRRGREVLQTVTDNLDDLAYVNDLRTYELKFVSRSFAKLVGKEPDALIGKPCWTIYGVDKVSPCVFCPMPSLRDLAESEGCVTTPHIWELHSSLNGKHYMMKDSLIKWLDGENVHLMTAVDITYRKQYEEQLKRTAATDAMTEVYNRQGGYAKLKELMTAPESLRRGMTLCFMDIDGLKRVNDKYGHAEGDDMIKNIVSIVHSCIRKRDFVCRWGGDEFIILLHCDLSDAKNVALKLEFALEHFNHAQTKPYALAVSLGMVGFGDSCDVDALIAEADKLMYHNKARKKTRRSTRMLNM